jgi:hypothetical protein
MHTMGRSEECLGGLITVHKTNVQGKLKKEVQCGAVSSRNGQSL